jgi:isovaleryl-CoA dehydrogenase
LSRNLQTLQETARRISQEVLSKHAVAIDRDAVWPQASLAAVAKSGLCGLHVPRRLGGLDEGMLALVVVTEELARECSSTALCYGMHCVASAVLAAKATPDQEERYLRPIANGSHLTSLALSEAGTGIHFYWPQTRLTLDGEFYVVNGTKHFVTSGGFADSYVVTSAHAGGNGDVGEFSALVLDAGTPGVTWTGDWKGFGMRGNASKALQLTDVRVPRRQLLGKEGDEVWYVFEVIAPYFLMAMSGVYIGIAAAALDAAVADVQGRQHSHTDMPVSEQPIVQHRVSELWLQVQQARQLVHTAARLADVGDPSALPALLGSKLAATTAAVDVTNGAMTLTGGRAYRENGTIARLLRDARAGHVMAPPTDLLHVWLGRTALGMPLL